MIFLSMKFLLGLFGGYIITSFILFKKPLIIHKKKRQHFVCRHISHRGGAGESYENTMAAFRRAVSLGTDMLELDCHLTRDNQVVVSHDHNLLRACGLNERISDLDYLSIPPLLQTVPIDFDPDRPFKGTGPEEERKIPLLNDVFKEFPHMPINIDIKINNKRLIEEVDKLVRQHKRTHLTVWGSFNDKITAQCYAQNSKIGLLFSMRRVIILLLLFYSGLLPLVPVKESFLEVFLPSIFLRRRKSASGAGFDLGRAKGREMGMAGLPLPTVCLYLMDTLLLRRALFDHLHQRGIQIYIWVLNSDDEFERAFQLGATGVMTDYPSRLKSFLEKHPQCY